MGQRDGLSPRGEPSLLNSRINHNLCLSGVPLHSLSYPLLPSLQNLPLLVTCRILSIMARLSSFGARSLSLRLTVRVCMCVRVCRCDFVTRSLRQIGFCAAGFGSTPREPLRKVKALRRYDLCLRLDVRVCHARRETEKQGSTRERGKNLQSMRARTNSHARPLLFHAILTRGRRRRLAHRRGVAMETARAAGAQ